MKALVTGAGGRLGAAMARELGRLGYDVALHYASSADGAQAVAEEIEGFGRRAVTLQADLLDLEACDALVPRAAQALGGPLTVLINNASIFEHDDIRTATHESWDRHIGSNLRAPFILTQAFAAQAPEARSDGLPLASAAIINMIDQRVRKLTPEFMTYSLAKSALWTLTQTAAQALAPAIRVNGIGPGPTMQGVRQSAQHFDAQRAATLLERGAAPDDILRAMRYLLEAPAITGQLICVDGGQHLAWQTPDVLGVE
ncbi:SDR family oxidoreductase [Jannaschia seohaensis]|uniref:NAD(P)-dependent dehydrogenase (Short-subunit alcohol dehydrogenase family) n=1 Tax=Jannaschia seohaensis TaxID=475081 RepID=A0A2Y9A323_9RHOB|nr:SDR family oxidoreductase [Jannaschia seohaensis]PWJ22327.1 NAD(P)-dependent dehydrogenase (short-subunit alcohol dehydrogenase family) [Jannaschia seohaensis]SSA38605.1 NAD(P)-dependent dehydrogenase, short-chain alcohol dehydrogenase family [Jannaschia seohaensis]